jgi:hypothetical protein
MNQNNTTKICQQQATRNQRRVVSPDSVTGGLLLAKDFFNNPKQYNLVKIPSLRETMIQYQIFPEAKDYLQKQLRFSKKILKGLDRSEQEYRYVIERKSKPEDKKFWLDLVNEIFINPWRLHHEAIIKRNTFILNDKPQTKNYLNVEKAKTFLITDLIQFKHRVAKCIFHDDKNASMYYYPQTNTCYCFGCQTCADSIKVYQTLNNCSFVEAVKKLQ